MWVINRISQIFLCSDFYVDRPTVMLSFLTVLDGARVGISNYIGLVCESCAWTWILLVFTDLRMIKSLDARLVKCQLKVSLKRSILKWFWDFLWTSGCGKSFVQLMARGQRVKLCKIYRGIIFLNSLEGCFLDRDCNCIFKKSADLYVFQHIDMKLINKTESIFLWLVVSFKKGLIYIETFLSFYILETHCNRWVLIFVRLE